MVAANIPNPNEPVPRKVGPAGAAPRDRRVRHTIARDVPGAEQRFAALIRRVHELQIEAAGVIHEVNEAAHFLRQGCASIGEWAERQGAGGIEALNLTRFGMTLAAAPEFAALVCDGEVDLEKAAVVGQVLANPRYVKDGDDWTAAARRDAISTLKRKVKRAVEQEAQKEPDLVPFSTHVTPEARADFEHARRIGSRKEKKNLTDGQFMRLLVDDYLDRYDPERRAARGRRVGDSKLDPGSRYIAAAVKRAIHRRSRGSCEFPGCRHKTFRQFAHVFPHAMGSGREAEDLFDFCTGHHALYDAGIIRLVAGDASDPTFEINGLKISDDGRIRNDDADDRGDGLAPPGCQEPPDGPPGGASVVSERIRRYGRAPVSRGLSKSRGQARWPYYLIR